MTLVLILYDRAFVVLFLISASGSSDTQCLVASCSHNAWSENSARTLCWQKGQEAREEAEGHEEGSEGHEEKAEGHEEEEEAEGPE